MTLPTWHLNPADADAALGPDHPLARALELQAVLTRDLIAVAALSILLAAATAAALIAWPAAVIGGALTLVLGVCALLAHQTVRERAFDLIAEGREGVPVGVVRRERDRLLEACYRQMLARSLERLRAAAERPAPWSPSATFPAHPRTLRAVDSELRELEALLSEPTRSARGVALAQKLIADAVSPLHGRDTQRLREELRRIKLVLSGLRV